MNLSWNSNRKHEHYMGSRLLGGGWAWKLCSRCNFPDKKCQNLCISGLTQPIFTQMQTKLCLWMGKALFVDSDKTTFCNLFLAVQNSSIGDLVTQFLMTIFDDNFRWQFSMTIFDNFGQLYNFDNFDNFWNLLTILTIFDNFDRFLENI